VYRVGCGYDIHRLGEARPLILGGVHLEYPRGLVGHSDADVLIHAIMDALLGAAGLGDIGQHFPPGDPAFLNADSRGLLRHVICIVSEAGFEVGNVDAVVVAEEPKISPHIASMKANLAADMGIAESRIGIKATTNEGLGAEGRKEGISAHAVALLKEV